jgi:hypothetical protein
VSTPDHLGPDGPGMVRPSGIKVTDDGRAAVRLPEKRHHAPVVLLTPGIWDSSQVWVGSGTGTGWG